QAKQGRTEVANGPAIVHVVQNILEVHRESQIVALGVFATSKSTASAAEAAATGATATAGAAKSAETTAAACATIACTTITATALSLSALILRRVASFTSETESLADSQIRSDGPRTLAVIARNDHGARDRIRIEGAPLGSDDPRLRQITCKCRAICKQRVAI